MGFSKGDKNINRKGRPRKPAVELPQLTAHDKANVADMLDAELWRVIRSAKAPTAVVSAIREMYNRLEGLPSKAQPRGNEITEPTARLVAELYQQHQCQDCVREHVHHVKPHPVQESTPRAEEPRVPLVEPTYNPPIPKEIVDAQNEEERKRVTTLLVKP